jgi:hypothetical protein
VTPDLAKILFVNGQRLAVQFPDTAWFIEFLQAVGRSDPKLSQIPGLLDGIVYVRPASVDAIMDTGSA